MATVTYRMRQRRSSDVLLVAIAAYVGILSSLAVQDGCFNIGITYDGRPKPGTPRAAYCAPIDGWYRWVLFPAGSMLLAFVLSRLLQRYRHARKWSLAIVLVVALANVVLSHALDYYHFEPL